VEKSDLKLLAKYRILFTATVRSVERRSAVHLQQMEMLMQHIFISSKANWENFEDNLPRYESYEPNR